ncbi:MAG TPA: RDD family protein [Verrucomicrobiae bacterium]|nr:RDD family protein [Verrucomicrobiae bacterium]
MKTHFKTCTFLALIALGLAVQPGLRGQDAPLPDAETNSVESVSETNTLASEGAETSNDEPRVHERKMGPVVTFGKTAKLKSDETAEAVVAIGGSADVKGRVREAVVSIFGDANVDSEVNDAVVAVLGNVRLGSNAVVHRDVVAIGGTVEFADGAVVDGQVQPIEIAIPGLPRLDSLKLWITECVFKMRPLSLQVRWVWIVAGIFVLLYFLVAIAFPKPVRICVDELTGRPATTFFVGLLAKILVPLLVLILAATGIGLLVAPFVIAAAFFGMLVGKAAVLEYLGTALGRPVGFDGKNQPLLALLIGTVLMLALYLVPFVGFLTFAILGMWGFGAAITGAIGRLSREKRKPLLPSGGGSTPSPGISPNFPSGVSTETERPAGGTGPAIPPVMNALDTSEFPKAGFWERMGAAFLDWALMLIPFTILGPLGWFVVLAYFAGMWTWKGTTIGGIVMNHRIVRQDGLPVTFVVALVRGLAAAFSAFILFLGFFWIGWNLEKQGWHDKIAGTYVLRMPRTIPLVCL